MDPAPASRHTPVLVRETLSWLAPPSGGVVADGTLGGGGHAARILERVGPGGRVLGLDRDPAAVAAARVRFAGQPLIAVHGDYRELPELAAAHGLAPLDGVLLDLGLSSDQLADERRGFSFEADGPLDLRFDPTTGEPAWRLLNRLDAQTLAGMIYRYGEERRSRRIARALVAARQAGRPVRTARDLARLVARCVPASGRRPRIHPATRTFQALRIAVNDELGALETALRRLPEAIKPGGRLVVISFHSLEDRLVKTAFRDDPRWTALTRKPVRPSEEEVRANPRARSARLRAAARANDSQ